MSKKQEMAANTEDSRKRDDLLSKMDVLIEAKDNMLIKLKKAEDTQCTTLKDVEELMRSLQFSNQKNEEMNSKLSKKADKTEVDVLMKFRSKRNNVVIWGVEEGSEREFNSLFQGHMKLEREVEVIRAHKINIKRNDRTIASPKPRLVHLYLLRDTDKMYIMKSAVNKLKDNKYKNSPIFISNDLSKTVREERAKLRKANLPKIKAKANVLFAFIPCSVPA